MITQEGTCSSPSVNHGLCEDHVNFLDIFVTAAFILNLYISVCQMDGWIVGQVGMWLGNEWVGRRVDRWMDEGMHRWVDKWLMNRLVGGWVDRQMVRGMGGWVDGWMDEGMDWGWELQRNGCANGQKDEGLDGWMEERMNPWTNGQTDEATISSKLPTVHSNTSLNLIPQLPLELCE